MSRYQTGKTNLDFAEARDSEWQWHQLGHIQVCTLLQTDNHTSTPPLCFLQAGCSSCRPTNSVKALKALFSYVFSYVMPVIKINSSTSVCYVTPSHFHAQHYIQYALTAVFDPYRLSSFCHRLKSGSILGYFDYTGDFTDDSALAEGPCNMLCKLNSCQLLYNCIKGLE